jgi:hypothetical protein
MATTAIAPATEFRTIAAVEFGSESGTWNSVEPTRSQRRIGVLHRLLSLRLVRHLRQSSSQGSALLLIEHGVEDLDYC